MSQKIQLKIEGMHCNACATGIDMLLSSKDGVLETSTDYSLKESQVEFDDTKIKIDDIKKTIEELGYKAILK